MRIDQLADRLAGSGERIAAGAGALTDADPGAGVFGADQPGRIGEVGRLLHRRWSTALAVRAREAAAHGARLVDSAELLQAAADRYRDTDASARARHDIEGP